MNCKSCFALVGFTSIAVVAGSLALAQGSGDPPTGQPPQLPPGWTQEDMMACMEAGTPGKMHETLAETVGQWAGTTKMWMAPEGEPMTSECTTTITPIMDGRYFRADTEGSFPGMGTFHGMGIYGYDNVSEKFQSVWVDNHSTAIMTGIGELSSDGETMTWIFSYTCPVTKKPTTLRQVERRNGNDEMTFEMYGIDPKSNREFKMMEIDYSRKPGTRADAGSTR